MELWSPANASASDKMIIQLGRVYSGVTIFCNLFLIIVILSKAELRGQVESFFLSKLKNILKIKTHIFLESQLFHGVSGHVQCPCWHSLHLQDLERCGHRLEPPR